MKVLLTAVLTVAALSSGSVVKAPGDTFELLILHNNDMHARFEQTSQLSGTCTTADREAGKCYGGFPRVAHVVKEARKAALSGEGPPVLYLNAGDTYTGTAWFTIYKWKIAAEFVNALQPDAVSLGNNEVDKKTLEISPFLENIDTYILASNVIIKSAEEKANIKKSIVFDIQGIKIGVVGYLTPENSILDSFGQVEYIDEVLAITEEVEKLQASNVNIIIALGHSTFNKEQEIAKEVAGIDMVIAGNVNTFNLKDDTASNIHQPTIVIQQSGKQVPIIPSTAYDKYLGSVKAKYDKNGDLLEFNVAPILLDSSIPQDSPSLEIVKSYSEEAIARNAEVIGNTSVVLDGESCYLEECNLGNLVTDAMVYCYATRYEGREWTDASIAIINEASVLTSRNIAPPNRPANITRGDLLSALHLQRGIVGVTMNGRTLRRILETSVMVYELNSSRGGFLQFSGIRVVYDLSRPSGSRLVSAVARCWNCYVPGLYEIEDWSNYRVLMPAELGTEGRYGYSFLTAFPRVELEYDVVTCTEEFIKLRSPLYPEVSGRIVLVRSDASSIVLSSTLLLVALISFALS